MRRVVLIATFASFIPALAFAMGCQGHEKQTLTCAPGSVWDFESQICIQNPTG